MSAPDDVPIQCLRLLALTLIALGAVQDLTVVFWYAHRGAYGPRRLWHILSVGIGLLLAYIAMAMDVLRLFLANSPRCLTSPLLVSSTLFVMYGVHHLWREARDRNHK